jgi:hypothetical protein
LFLVLTLIFLVAIVTFVEAWLLPVIPHLVKLATGVLVLILGIVLLAVVLLLAVFFGSILIRIEISFASKSGAPFE